MDPSLQYFPCLMIIANEDPALFNCNEYLTTNN